jgi:hypothetical protein
MRCELRPDCQHRETSLHYRQLTPLVQVWDERNQAKSQISTSRLSLHESLGPQIKGLVAKHIFLLREKAAIQRTLSTAIQLPQMVVPRFHKTHKVQIHAVLGRRCSRVSFRRCGPVRALERFRLVQQLCSSSWV